MYLCRYLCICVDIIVWIFHITSITNKTVPILKYTKVKLIQISVSVYSFYLHNITYLIELPIFTNINFR